MKKIHFPQLKLSSLFFFLSLLPLGFFSVFAPQQNIVVGHTAGQFSVNDAGAATYAIPITVSPGTAGLAPNLSLAYSSQGGTGLMGLGWSLQGLSSINRSSKTLAQDGEIHGVDFSSDDTYSLDGERLRVISGGYGANGAEYRTEQNSFMRIISYGNREGAPERFKVWTKAGLIMEYGYTESAQIESQGITQQRDVIIHWLLNKVTDTKGNYYTITYTKGYGGEHNPTRIDYTGNAEGTSQWQIISGITVPTWTLTDLTENSNYEWQIRSQCGEGFYSSWKSGSFTTLSNSTCATPSNLTTDNITKTSAKFNWTASTDPTTYYTVQYRIVGNAAWDSWSNIYVGTSFTPTLLRENTDYEWQVQTRCQNGQTSDWSSSIFTTTPTSTCDKAVDLVTSNIIDGSATLSWSSIPNTTSYDIAYKANSGNWNFINGVENTSYRLTNLSTSEGYSWYIRRTCNNGIISFSDISSFLFQIFSSCPNPSELNTINTTNTATTLTWNTVPTAIYYSIGYQVIGEEDWINIHNITDTNYRITGLTPNTTYRWSMGIICNEELKIFWPWTNPITFTTTSGTANPDNLVLNENPILDGIYCANIDITTAGSVNPGSDVTMMAGSYVKLMPGFYAKQGSELHAYINTCDASTIVNENSSLELSRNQTIKEQSPILKDSKLDLQVIPNPFKQKTTIRFFLPKESPVQIKIINLNGQSLAQQQKSGIQGWNSIELDAFQMPPGMYYVVLHTNLDMSTEKIMILK